MRGNSWTWQAVLRLIKFPADPESIIAERVKVKEVHHVHNSLECAFYSTRCVRYIGIPSAGCCHSNSIILGYEDVVTLWDLYVKYLIQ